jgi:hypothetical protein
MADFRAVIRLSLPFVDKILDYVINFQYELRRGRRVFCRLAAQQVFGKNIYLPLEGH